MEQYKDFQRREREIRESFDPTLSIPEVRRILGCSAAVIVNLVKSGQLQAYQLDGTATDRRTLSHDTRGLRILPSSLESYLESIRVK